MAFSECYCNQVKLVNNYDYGLIDLLQCDDADRHVVTATAMDALAALTVKRDFERYSNCNGCHMHRFPI